MDRTRIEQAPLGNELSYDVPSKQEDAERWLTAIHVIYEEGMPEVCAEMRSLRKSQHPHVQIRTAPSFKKHHLVARKKIDLCLDGGTPCITSLRRKLRDRSRAGLSPRSRKYLDRCVCWTDDIPSKAPYAETVYRLEAE